MSFTHEMSLSLAMPSCFTALEELLRSELRNEKEEGREGHELRELKIVTLEVAYQNVCSHTSLSKSLGMSEREALVLA